MTQAAVNNQQGSAAPANEQAAAGQQAQEGQQQAASQQAQAGQQQGQMVPLTALQEERAKAKELRDQVQNLTQLVQEVQSRMGQQQVYGQPPMQIPPAQNYYPAQSFQQPQQNLMQQAAQLWEQDPMQATAWMIENGIQHYDGMQRAVDGQKAQAMGKYKDYPTYATEIDNYVRALPPAQRTQPGIVDMAYYLVKGQKVEALTQQAQQEVLSKIQKGEQVQGLQGTYTPSAQATSDDEPLSQQEQAAAMVMGVKPEDYKKHKSRRQK